MDWWHLAEVGGSPRFKLLPQRMQVSAIHRKREGLSLRTLMGVLRSHPHGCFMMLITFVRGKLVFCSLVDWLGSPAPWGSWKRTELKTGGKNIMSLMVHYFP